MLNFNPKKRTTFKDLYNLLDEHDNTIKEIDPKFDKHNNTIKEIYSNPI